MNELQTFLSTGVFAFLMTFVRIGTAFMLMPGYGNMSVPTNIKLSLSLAFAAALFPLIQAKLPAQLPAAAPMLMLIVMEFVYGLFIGTLARVLMAALDTAGMIISTQSSLANAMLFNPAFASQGSVIGTALSLTGIVLLFVTDLHHMLILSVTESYDIFPIGSFPAMADMADILTKAVSASFSIGIQITAPFLIVIMVMYVGMGVLAKLMPQIQVFMLAVPIQVVTCLLILMAVLSSLMMIWLASFQNDLAAFLNSGAAGG